MNPLIQSIGGVPTNPSAPNLGDVVRMLRSGNPQQMAANLMQNNPQFRAFVESNRGKTPEQVAQEHGVNLNEIMGQFR